MIGWGGRMGNGSRYGEEVDSAGRWKDKSLFLNKLLRFR
jgi:hypothetical protein